jgi:hypothetical protein
MNDGRIEFLTKEDAERAIPMLTSLSLGIREVWYRTREGELRFLAKLAAWTGRRRRKSPAFTLLLLAAVFSAAISTLLAGYMAVSTPDVWSSSQVMQVAPGVRYTDQETYDRPWWVYAPAVVFGLATLVVLALLMRDLIEWTTDSA